MLATVTIWITLYSLPLHLAHTMMVIFFGRRGDDVVHDDQIYGYIQKRNTSVDIRHSMYLDCSSL